MARKGKRGIKPKVVKSEPSKPEIVRLVVPSDDDLLSWKLFYTSTSFLPMPDLLALGLSGGALHLVDTKPAGSDDEYSSGSGVQVISKHTFDRSKARRSSQDTNHTQSQEPNMPPPSRP